LNISGPATHVDCPELELEFDEREKRSTKVVLKPGG
jgi:hypothetical protein